MYSCTFRYMKWVYIQIYEMSVHSDRCIRVHSDVWNACTFRCMACTRIRIWSMLESFRQGMHVYIDRAYICIQIWQCTHTNTHKWCTQPASLRRCSSAESIACMLWYGVLFGCYEWHMIVQRRLSIYMYMYVYICMYVYTHTQIHTHTDIHI